MIETQAEKRARKKAEEAAAKAAAAAQADGQEIIVLSRKDLQSLIDSSIQKGIQQEMAALAPSLSTALVVPSSIVALSPKADEEEEEAPFAPVLSSYRYVKVDFAAVPQIKEKDNIKE
uniref:Uncharacterized protein n=1 Tax=Chromera velia CCMP2878 TaxID=1169474 RepID=A0A0G4FTA3_9ALVE|eukprot:Cvel_3695.t1-p1 / transcript=Cvel_3695.t1 / gene=Cvel_3695 / organism=Chromera_velia_CCMP2878 / gene_product=hypothetical protein / transcript_product=hypothetical protein / location=Cvel_scaffold153:108870-109220(+) / protein_length=117 / sequence_SO=supercontig / SO=protein_coding / is_pseudo=false